MSIEKSINIILQRYPRLKRVLKRIYQVGMYSLSHKVEVEGDVIRVSPDDGFEYFFGYYDKSPWDITDRYMICMKARETYKSVAPAEAIEILLIDTQNNNSVIKLADSKAWCVQQGCMAQWLGPDFKSRIIYNDFRYNRYCSVIYNIERMEEERVFELPVYDVAKDGSFALSLDFSRLHRLRPGYGYSNLSDTTQGEDCPEKPCIWRLDLNSGISTVLYKYTDLAGFEHRAEMEGAEHKVNHIMLSPNGMRFMVLHRWFNGTKKYTRLVTSDSMGGGLYNLSDDDFVSHCYWKNDVEILSFLAKKESGRHYYIMKDRTEGYSMLWPELDFDGHPSYSADSSLIVTDSYPSRTRMASVYVICGDIVKEAARVFVPFRYDNDVRCDLHPRWNRKGDKICIDSVHGGKRGLYIVALHMGENERVN